jgi:hypothetical protein
VPFIGACWRLRTVITGTVLCAPEHFRLVAPFESDHFRLADQDLSRADAIEPSGFFLIVRRGMSR